MHFSFFLEAMPLCDDEQAEAGLRIAIYSLLDVVLCLFDCLKLCIVEAVEVLLVLEVLFESLLDVIHFFLGELDVWQHLLYLVLGVLDLLIMISRVVN